jgi:hypothetical protein
MSSGHLQSGNDPGMPYFACGPWGGPRKKKRLRWQWIRFDVEYCYTAWKGDNDAERSAVNAIHAIKPASKRREHPLMSMGMNCPIVVL